MVFPIVDYCSQLWNPTTQGSIQKIESIQSSFLKKISGMSQLDYWNQLNTLGMYSLQRRRERYICIYVWKIIEAHVPNFGIEVSWNNRTGRNCRVPQINPSARGKVKTIRFSSMGVNGPRIFNRLPKSIKNMSGCSVTSFKNALDRHLAEIPDEPRIPGLIKFCARGGNSLLDY